MLTQEDRNKLIVLERQLRCVIDKIYDYHSKMRGKEAEEMMLADLELSQGAGRIWTIAHGRISNDGQSNSS